MINRHVCNMWNVYIISKEADRPFKNSTEFSLCHNTFYTIFDAAQNIYLTTILTTVFRIAQRALPAKINIYRPLGCVNNVFIHTYIVWYFEICSAKHNNKSHPIPGWWVNGLIVMELNVKWSLQLACATPRNKTKTFVRKIKQIIAITFIISI